MKLPTYATNSNELQEKKLEKYYLYTSLLREIFSKIDRNNSKVWTDFINYFTIKIRYPE